MKRITLTPRLVKVYEFAKKWHKGQVRKYCGSEYITHLLNVTLLVVTWGELSMATAILHDIIEDTDCTIEMLSRFIHSIYNEEEAHFIIQGVYQLTDLYTKVNFPDMNRSKRKRKEALRLAKIEPVYQTIKYADTYNNNESILVHGQAFKYVYAREKLFLMSVMTEGNIALRHRIYHQLKPFNNA